MECGGAIRLGGVHIGMLFEEGADSIAILVFGGIDEGGAAAGGSVDRNRE
jgi:hypothetical protein